MKIFALILLFALSAHATGPTTDARKPAQDYGGGSNPFPSYPPLPGGNAGTTPAPASGTFNTEEVVTAGANVQQIYCLGIGGNGAYQVGASGNDYRVTRVASAGAVSYEIRRGQRFVAACGQIYIMGR